MFSTHQDKKYTKTDSYILQDEDDSDKWSHFKIYPTKNEYVNTNQYYRRKEVVKDLQNTIKTVSFERQEK